MLCSKGTDSGATYLALAPTSASYRLLVFGKSLYLCEPQFSHLTNGDNSRLFCGAFSGLNEAVKVKPQ